MTNLQQTLKTLRKHLTVRELAEESGVSQATIYGWINGTWPQGNNLKAFRSFLVSSRARAILCRHYR